MKQHPNFVVRNREWVVLFIFLVVMSVGYGTIYLAA